MAVNTYKQFDTYPPLTATLLSGGNPINLTGATSVKIILKGTKQQAPALVTGTCTIVTPSAGTISYAWATNDLSVADTYNVEFEIHWTAGSTIQTVPNNAYDQVIVMADLEGA